MSATILCATDLGDSGAVALAWAAAWAKSTGGRLVALHVDDDDHGSLQDIPDSVRPGAEAMASRLDLRRTEHRVALERELAKYGVASETRIAAGRPWETVLEVATDVDATLVVVGPHEHGLGSTARRVVTHADRPVLVARGPAPTSLEGLTWTLGVPPLEEATPVVRHVTALAGGTSGRVVFVRALPVLPTLPEAEAIDAGLLMQTMVSGSEDDLRAFAAELSPDAEIVVEVAAPHRLLTRVAEEHGGILAVAAHDRGFLERLFLGSVSERCLRHAKTPVYVERA